VLVITAGKEEFFDEAIEEFKESDGFQLRLEHSLASVSKWESKYQRPFLDSVDKTSEEILDYIVFMILDDVDTSVVNYLSSENLKEINAYIESPQSATTFGVLPKTQSYRGEIVTSELIYYWMVAYNIPFSCEDWHLNRLLSLVKICNIKNSKPSKMTKAQVAQRNREINERRKQELGTSG
jgi:hypothetical protein